MHPVKRPLATIALSDGSPVTWDFTHDDNGNLTSKTDATDTWDYPWDEQHRLVVVELNSSPVVSYEYDSASRLIQRVEGGTTTNYHWDGWDLIREEKTVVINETTNYLVPFGEVLAFERGGDWFYLHGDALSSTQLVTDENGDQVGRFIYGAWGEELYASESVPGILENRFVGGLGCRRDAATGLIYMRHRWYDPACQRFISKDPLYYGPQYVTSRKLLRHHLIIDYKNLYAYCQNAPMNVMDPQGTGPLSIEYIPKALRLADWGAYHCSPTARFIICEAFFLDCHAICLGLAADAAGTVHIVLGAEYFAMCEASCIAGQASCNAGDYPDSVVLVPGPPKIK